MLDKVTMFAMIGSAFVFGCDTREADETQEVIDNLVEAGFRAEDILVAGGDVYAGRDAHVTLAASREMLEPGEGTAEHYRTTNLMCGKTRICINPTASFNSYSQLSAGLDQAIINYNVLPLVFDFVRGPASGCNANITITTTSGTGANSGFPSGCNPYGMIRATASTRTSTSSATSSAMRSASATRTSTAHSPAEAPSPRGRLVSEPS
jgi:hypothetical protein